MPLVALALAAAQPSHANADTDLRADLGSAIALLGLPCGKVLETTRLAENDQLVRCSDGNRYRVFINTEGRVVAQKR